MLTKGILKGNGIARNNLDFFLHRSKRPPIFFTGTEESSVPPPSPWFWATVLSAHTRLQSGEFPQELFHLLQNGFRGMLGCAVQPSLSASIVGCFYHNHLCTPGYYPETDVNFWGFI